jgi:hypothetical protein
LPKCPVARSCATGHSFLKGTVAASLRKVKTEWTQLSVESIGEGESENRFGAFLPGPDKVGAGIVDCRGNASPLNSSGLPAKLASMSKRFITV